MLIEANALTTTLGHYFQMLSVFISYILSSFADTAAAAVYTYNVPCHAALKNPLSHEWENREQDNHSLNLCGESHFTSRGRPDVHILYNTKMLIFWQPPSPI